eukprot:TRINITY_DN3647_c0_g2_i1.p1 TRINITY_DN3647_c0_g2~~TRINITY_DN3647_c0_g2_i1.p1  ORF type:complete len:154 (+),score=11.72 TRINITY_DN3647_c0_g2_i1:70-531(+)
MLLLLLLPSDVKTMLPQPTFKNKAAVVIANAVVVTVAVVVVAVVLVACCRWSCNDPIPLAPARLTKGASYTSCSTPWLSWAALIFLALLLDYFSYLFRLLYLCLCLARASYLCYHLEFLSSFLLVSFLFSTPSSSLPWSSVASRLCPSPSPSL